MTANESENPLERTNERTTNARRDARTPRRARSRTDDARAVASDRVSHRARRATTTRARAFECRLHRFPNHRQTETVGLVVAPRGATTRPTVSVALARALASVSSRARGFSGFFRAIDGDGDGELTTRELRRYFDGVGGRDLDERREVARAARATVETMDTEDEGTTVNLRELRRVARGMALSLIHISEPTRPY